MMVMIMMAVGVGDYFTVHDVHVGHSLRVMGVHMGVAFLGCSAEKPAYFVRREVRYHLFAFFKCISDSRNGMSVKHALHHLLVHG